MALEVKAKCQQGRLQADQNTVLTQWTHRRQSQQVRLTKRKKVENAKAMTQAVTQAATEATKIEMQAISEAEGPTQRNNATVTTPSMSTRSSRPVVKQVTFDWKCQDQYNELLNFEMDVKILMTMSYNICDSERFTVIINCLGCEGLQFV